MKVKVNGIEIETENECSVDVHPGGTVRITKLIAGELAASAKFPEGDPAKLAEQRALTCPACSTGQVEIKSWPNPGSLRS